MLSETDIETSRKYDGSATVCECTITDYLSVLGPEGTESKNADGLLVVVFLSSTSNFSNLGNFLQYSVNADWFAASRHVLCCLRHCLMADSIVGLVCFQ